MKNIKNTKIHWSYWVISLFGLLWNLGGCINFVMQMNLEFVTSLPETHKAIIIDRPSWATIGFGLGVFLGALGCLLLLLRKSLAFHSFIASLLGIIITMIHTIHVASFKIAFSFMDIFIMIVLPVIVAVLLLWYTKLVNRKNWIN